MGNEKLDWVQRWLKSARFTTPAEAYKLASIIRHAAVHGVLTPDKCMSFGFIDALAVLPKSINEVHCGTIFKIFQSVEGDRLA
jgi:hypothetical protein